MREEEFDALCSWGEALVRDPRAEVVAAGRAIQLLAAEVERLEMELWNLRLGVAEAEAQESETISSAQSELVEELRQQVTRGARLRRLLAAPSRHFPSR